MTTELAPRLHTRPLARFDELPLVKTVPTSERLVVACILDEFSSQCFGPEADLVPLSPDNWEVELCAAQPDLLLVESAWRGHRELWWNTVPRLASELVGILDWCRERAVPTAFWNKEDPVHFATFLRVAAQFDSVFTTDMDCVPRYKARLGHDRVHFLPFAAQPAIHNPLETFNRSVSTAFAGAYYRKYPHRTADLDALSEVLRHEGGLAIYDRNHGRALPENEFPDAYRQEIVGGLKPSEIGVAYKGYVRNLNLNSVKQSQSMFARRVFELMASNTLVVSNYSRGLRSMFGDLVLSTDDPAELKRSLRRIDSVALGAERVRLAALRKVLSEHTYAHRLSFMAEVNGLAIPQSGDSRVLLAAHVATVDDIAAIRDAASRQTWPALATVIELGGDLSPADLGDEREWPSGALKVVDRLDVASVYGVASDTGCASVALLDADDYYGANYVTDAALTFTWSSVDAAGKARRFRASGGRAVLDGSAESYVPTTGLSPRSTLVRVGAFGQQPARRRIHELELKGLAIDPFNYCQGGAKLDGDALAPILDRQLTIGASLQAMQLHAGQATVEVDDGLGISLGDLMAGLASRRDVDIDLTGELPTVVSRLKQGQHTYVYSSRRLGLDILDLATDPFVFFECTPGLDLMLVFMFLGPDGERLGHSMASNLRNVSVVVPEGTVSMKLGLRILGPGSTTIKRFIPRQHHEASSGILPGARDLVLTNIYPAYDNLYRNAFIHSRVRAYRARGYRMEVLASNRASASLFREFEDVDVAEVPSEEIGDCFSPGAVDNVLVHFLDRDMWQVLRNQPEVKSINVWVHGSEIQPWWRRAFNYETEADIERAKLLSEERVAFWQEVFREAPPNMHFVFVSASFAETVFDDLRTRLERDRYSIIHNPIDTSIFRYVAKPPEQRRRVLSIRPYASRTYANDLSVEAVRILSERPGFENLEFCFIGDGPLFDETLEPLREFKNVEIRREFLTHEQIADIHREFGVFLIPTRMDSHGVSRDEAMASGLVPVTTAVAAVPEFVDAECGFLAEAEDAQGLADAVWAVANDEEMFVRMSRNASQRVAERTAADVIIPRELALLER